MPYIANAPIEHEGRTYAPGEEFEPGELNEQDLRWMLEGGAITAVDMVRPQEETAAPTPIPGDMAALRDITMQEARALVECGYAVDTLAGWIPSEVEEATAGVVRAKQVRRWQDQARDRERADT